MVLPRSVIEIDNGAFDDWWSKLKTLIAGSAHAMYALGEYFMEGAELVLTEDFLSLVNEIRINKNIAKLVSLTSVPPVPVSFTNSQIMDMEVYVPTSALEVYKQAEGWKDLWCLQGGAENMDVTGVENVSAEKKERWSKTYSLNGVEVDKAAPGSIYIRNGKKHVAR